MYHIGSHRCLSVIVTVQPPLGLSQQLIFFAVPQIFGEHNVSFSPTERPGTGNVYDMILLSSLQVLLCSILKVCSQGLLSLEILLQDGFTIVLR